MQFRIVAAALVLTALSVHVEPAVAQDAYPSRAVRILLSFPPGSSPDIRTRIIANQLTTLWGKQVIVENRPGAGGALSVQALLATPADGYSLLGSAASLFTILPAQKDKLTFDVNRDIVPVALTGSEGMVFAVSPKLGVNTLAEFIALAKAQPDKLVIGTNPAGSLPHLAAQLFVKLSKAPVIVVPTTGGTNEAIREILGGRAHVVIESRPAIKAHLESGDLKPLAIMTPERLAAIPDLPAAAETVPGTRRDRLERNFRAPGHAGRCNSTSERKRSAGDGCPGNQGSARAKRHAVSAAVHSRLRPLHRTRAETLVANREGNCSELRPSSFVRRSGDAVSKLDWAGDGAECVEAFTGTKDRHVAKVEHAPED